MRIPRNQAVRRWVWAMLLLTFFGCSHARTGAPVAYNENSIERLAAYLEYTESQRPISRQRIVQILDQAYARDLERTPANLTTMGAWLRGETRRFTARHTEIAK